MSSLTETRLDLMWEKNKQAGASGMKYHGLVVDRPLSDWNHFEHDGALRPRLLIGCKKEIVQRIKQHELTTWVHDPNLPQLG